MERTARLLFLSMLVIYDIIPSSLVRTQNFWRAISLCAQRTVEKTGRAQVPSTGQPGAETCPDSCPDLVNCTGRPGLRTWGNNRCPSQVPRTVPPT
jgi:hypothetical protein